MTEALFPEEAYVEILKVDDPYSPTGAAAGSNIQVTTDIDNFEEGGFERETEYRPFFNNAKVTIKKQQNPGEITVNAKITRALWDQILWGGTGSDFTSGGDQENYRLIFLVTKETGITAASQALTGGFDHYRKIYANCNMTTFNPKLEVEGMLEGEATFSIPPTDEAANPNIRAQISGTAAFSAVGSFTASQNWD